MTGIDAGPSPVAFAYSVVDTAKLIGVSQSQIYELFDTGDLAHLKIGARTLIERTEIDRFLAAHRVG
jgi:excisionase family DNA binding protein